MCTIGSWSIKTKGKLYTLYHDLCRYWQSSDFLTEYLVCWLFPSCRYPLEKWCFVTVAGQHWLSTSSTYFLWDSKYWDRIGLSRTLKYFSRSFSYIVSCVVWVVCLELFSCWKTQPCSTFDALFSCISINTQIVQIMTKMHLLKGNSVSNLGKKSLGFDDMVFLFISKFLHLHNWKHSCRIAWVTWSAPGIYCLVKSGRRPEVIRGWWCNTFGFTRRLGFIFVLVCNNVHNGWNINISHFFYICRWHVFL